MPDLATERGRVIAAALRLAAERPWSEVRIADIAAAAGVTLDVLRGSLATKARILAAFARDIDDEVLRRAPRPDPNSAPRDRLFEIVMSRFDALQPHRAALRSISASGGFDPELLRSLVGTQAWMLNAAGIATEGPGGLVRVAGLATVYGAVARTWLEDDDPGLARTMAALDRRLRRGESALRSAEDACAGASRFASALWATLSGGFGRASKPETADPPSAASAAGTGPSA